MSGIRPDRIRLPEPASPAMVRGERVFVLAALAAILLLQLELVLNRPVNWDEFYHLSLAHALGQGRLSEVLQVLHVRLLGWVAALPLGEIGQIRVTRLVMFGFELFTLAAIYALARRFAEDRIAVLAPLLYLSAGFVFQHGFSFRADPLVTALLMGALWLLAASRLDGKALAALAVLLALGGFATIKAVLFAPAFAAIAWQRLRDDPAPRALTARLATSLALAAALFGLLVWWASLGAAPAPTGSAASTVKASQSMLLAEGLLPRWHYLLLMIGTAPVFALALAVSLARLAKDKALPRLVLAGLILPLASVVFYRNAFPYFYAFILAPVAIGILPGIAWLAQRYGARSLAGIAVLACVVLSAVTPRAVLADQQAVLREVHRLFPQPAAYFDFAGMVAPFPKANAFMTTWGQTRYRNGETESYRAAMARLNVPLLLANNDVLVRNQSPGGPAWEILPEDAKALREGYVQHWGPIWLAGQRFAAGSAPREFTIHAAGDYTLLGEAALIDGLSVRPGAVIRLAKGSHRFAPLTGGETVLRWGKDLPQPLSPPPADIPFKDF